VRELLWSPPIVRGSAEGHRASNQALRGAKHGAADEAE